jgi:hypothetical protein
MKASELAADARDELFQGWTQSAYVTNEGTVCAIGAVERVAMRNMAFAQAGVVQAALDEKAAEIFGKPCLVQEFNDYMRTTKQDMLDLFDKTVIGLEEKGL